MIDLGLLGGWTAGGPATDPGVPAVDFASATGVPDETGIAALDAAFRDLMDALTPAVEPSALGAAGELRTGDDSADAAEPAAEIAPEVTPVFWPTRPAAGRAVFSGAERPEKPHAIVSDEQELPATPKSVADDPTVNNIVIVAGPVPAPIVVELAPAPIVQAPASAPIVEAPAPAPVPIGEAPVQAASRASNSALIADQPDEEVAARVNVNQKAIPANQKAIPAYEAQVQRAASAAIGRDAVPAPQAQLIPTGPSPVPVQASDEPVETQETKVSAARLHVPGPSAVTPAAAEQFDADSQRDQSEARRSAFTFTFPKPLGHELRAAVEAIASAKTGSAPQSLLTFTLPVPAPLRTSSGTAVAAPVTFSPGLQASQDTADQIVQAIRLTFTRGGGEARIRLDPRQFGDLSIALRVDRGEVVARLQAETSEVRDWLRTNQHLLREGLAQHDLRLDRLEIAASAEERQDARDADDDRQERGDDGRRAAQRKARARETSAVFEIVA